MPTALAASLVALFVLADAPIQPLDLTTITAVLERLGVKGGVILLFVSASVSITLQPLQFRLVQLCEGYWSSPLLAWLYRIGTWRQGRRFDRWARNTSSATVDDPVKRRLAQARRDAAKESLSTRMPPDRDHLLPTALGNVLRAMEERAGARYGIESIAIWQRLYPVLPAEHAQTLEDEVTQLDVSVRLATTWLVTAVGLTAYVLRDPTQAWEHRLWLVALLCIFLAAWLSYRAAIESALAHAADVEVTIDLYRDLLLDAARMPSAATLKAETMQFQMLGELFRANGAGHAVDYPLVPRRLTGPRPDRLSSPSK